MKLKEVSEIRTGLVTSRKKVMVVKGEQYEYQLINLKCIAETGFLDVNATETFYTKEKLKDDYITKLGDILVRLSSPYTAVQITEDAWCGLVIPSHFAIIRVNCELVTPEYILWVLNNKRTKHKILQNNSGSSAFGTIRSGFFAELTFNFIPLEKQKILARLILLGEREHRLLSQLIEEKNKYNRACIRKAYDTLKKE